MVVFFRFMFWVGLQLGFSSPHGIPATGSVSVLPETRRSGEGRAAVMERTTPVAAPAMTLLLSRRMLFNSVVSQTKFVSALSAGLRFLPGLCVSCAILCRDGLVSWVFVSQSSWHVQRTSLRPRRPCMGFARLPCFRWTLCTVQSPAHRP